jgi:hypothetical protein
MTRTIVVMAAALALAVTLPAVSAQSQSPRTFVSAAGSDSNPCTFAAPCRHFQAAVNATSAGGEVDALDPAGYGPITISHAITIEGQGWSYIAPPAGGNAITISAGVSDQITIRGVSLNGVGISGTTNGIVFNFGGALTVKDCVISNMANDGIHFIPSNSGSISVSNTFVGNNGQYGIWVAPQGSASATAVFDRVLAQFNGPFTYGIALDGEQTTGTVSGTATDSVSSSNGGGFLAQGNLPTPQQVILTVVRSVAANNHTGVRGFGTGSNIFAGVANIAQSTITNNVVGCEGITQTYVDNYSYGNSIDECDMNPIKKE